MCRFFSFVQHAGKFYFFDASERVAKSEDSRFSPDSHSSIIMEKLNRHDADRFLRYEVLGIKDGEIEWGDHPTDEEEDYADNVNGEGWFKSFMETPEWKSILALQPVATQLEFGAVSDDALLAAFMEGKCSVMEAAENCNGTGAALYWSSSIWRDFAHHNAAERLFHILACMNDAHVYSRLVLKPVCDIVYNKAISLLTSVKNPDESHSSLAIALVKKNRRTGAVMDWLPKVLNKDNMCSYQIDVVAIFESLSSDSFYAKRILNGELDTILPGVPEDSKRKALMGILNGSRINLNDELIATLLRHYSEYIEARACAEAMENRGVSDAMKSALITRMANKDERGYLLKQLNLSSLYLATDHYLEQNVEVRHAIACTLVKMGIIKRDGKKVYGAAKEGTRSTVDTESARTLKLEKLVSLVLKDPAKGVQLAICDRVITKHKTR